MGMCHKRTQESAATEHESTRSDTVDAAERENGPIENVVKIPVQALKQTIAAVRP
jgi:hypothetical protein